MKYKILSTLFVGIVGYIIISVAATWFVADIREAMAYRQPLPTCAEVFKGTDYKCGENQ